MTAGHNQIDPLNIGPLGGGGGGGGVSFAAVILATGDNVGLLRSSTFAEFS
jgi:hypothetical protein